MRIIFIGQAPFGAESLEKLLAQGDNVVGVITTPDVPGQKHPNPVKQCAEKHNVSLFQSKLLKKPAAVSWVENLQPDLLVLAFVTSFVPAAMIDLARFGGINYHPSLLPKYRGGSAINWAVINGEPETGVTIHYIDEGVDTGPILLQKKVPIGPDDTVKSIYFAKLYPLGIEMIAEAVRLIKAGKAVPTNQDESQASFQPVITGKDTAINWNLPVGRIYNLIRGSNPAPGAVTSYKGNSCKIFDAAIDPAVGSPGLVIDISAKGFLVAATEGSILVKILQPAGSKKIPAADFVRDNKLKPGDKFGS